MMLFHPYHPGAPLVHSAAHGSAMYMPGLGTSRPVYNGGKEESMMGLQGPGQQQQQQPQPQLFGGQALNMAAPIHQPNSQKRSRSPSPPPQLYHSYKPPMLSPYNPSKHFYNLFLWSNWWLNDFSIRFLLESIGNPYGGSPAVPGSIFYTHSVSVSAASGAGYQLPAPGSMYNYASSRPSSYPLSAASKEELPSPKHPVYVGQQVSTMTPNPQRSICKWFILSFFYYPW